MMWWMCNDINNDNDINENSIENDNDSNNDILLKYY